MKTGLLFDLDGTLLDTLEDLLDATNHALAVCGYPAKTLPQLRSVVGNGAANQIRKSLPEGTPEDVVEQVLAVYKPYYTANCQNKTAPYPGICQALQTLRLCCGGKAAMICITQEMLASSGATLEDTEGIPSVPRNIEGVSIGATLKERPEGGFKISIRTDEDVDASEICAAFGGGGHKRAAGCLIKEPVEQVMTLLEAQFEAVLSGGK